MFGLCLYQESGGGLSWNFLVIWRKFHEILPQHPLVLGFCLFTGGNAVRFFYYAFFRRLPPCHLQSSILLSFFLGGFAGTNFGQSFGGWEMPLFKLFPETLSA